MSQYYCVTHDAGPWSEDEVGSDGNSIVKLHRNLGCKIVEEKDKPRLRGKANWGKTWIEKLFTDYMIKNYDEMLHEVIASYKVGKICLIRNKWQYLYPIGNSYQIGVKQ